MLKELRIQNFAIIDALHVHFAQGLHVFTGETGAGKSIIVEALSLALGGRASAEMIRTGADMATIEAAFDLSGQPDVIELAGVHGIDINGEELLIKRVISASRSRVYINGALSTVAVLELLGSKLVEIHGQYEQQTLLHTEHQLDIFDSYAGVFELRHALERRYYYLQGLRKRLADLTAQVEERSRRQQLLQFQLHEIDEAQLQPGEEDDLKGQRHLMMHTEKLLQVTQGSSDLLYAGEDTVVERLARVLSGIDGANLIDPALKPVTEELRAALYQLEEAGRTLGNYASRVEFDPLRLAEIEERLAELNALKRKYGASVEDILAQRDSLAEALESLQHQSEDMEALRQEIDLTTSQLGEQALDLSRRRVAVGETLAQAVEHELHDLSMSAARFVIAFHRTPDAAGCISVDGTPVQLLPIGLENVEFLFTSNPGEEPRPLAKIASGGEVSRVMLALKRILATVERVPTLVFDEVDAGIGGGVAEVVGRKLKALTDTCQVFCITHLPQVASRGDIHFLIEKQVVLGRTSTTVRPLTQRERVDEIARMSGGLVITDTTRRLAAELLRQGARD